MKAGAPNGAAASRRADEGSKPPISRPRARCPPIDPLTPISAVIDDTAWQARSASSCTAAMSAAGDPGPDGSLMSDGAPHPEQSTASAAPRKTRKHESRDGVFGVNKVRVVRLVFCALRERRGYRLFIFC